ncbi:MAG: hypothetical protein NVSMB9_22570 [Isosphaeraceae bacterium]
MNRRLLWIGPGIGLTLVLTALGPVPGREPARAPDVGRSYRVPYQLTATNHFLVRARINGKGPFNFLVDTGAPAFYIATETARKVGLKPRDDAFWTPVERLDVEGGATLRDVKARVEDPFQLVGMNALGLPGASIDGLMGFTVLARFRLELDPTQDRMTWTRLDFEPRDPPAPMRAPGAGAPQPAGGMQAMNALGALSKVAAALVGKQPEDERVPRGFLGLELAGDEKAGGVRVARVLVDSPAAKAGVRDGDQLVRVEGREVLGPKQAREAVAGVRPGEAVGLTLRRNGGPADLELSVTAGEGF